MSLLQGEVKAYNTADKNSHPSTLNCTFKGPLSLVIKLLVEFCAPSIYHIGGVSVLMVPLTGHCTTQYVEMELNKKSSPRPKAIMA